MEERVRELERQAALRAMGEGHQEAPDDMSRREASGSAEKVSLQSGYGEARES
jgi:hypothetical protein